MTPPIPEPSHRSLLAYDLAGRALFAGMLPSIAWKMWRRGKYRTGLRERFGIYGAGFREARSAIAAPLWFQAVSVGETVLAARLIAETGDRFPALPVALSTTTTTGQAEAVRRVGGRAQVFYYPLDFRGAAGRALSAVAPRMLALLESEIWPNLILGARRRGVPVFVLNARMSERSAAGYARWPSLFRPVFGGLDLVCAQTGDDAERLRRLGAAPERLHVVGNVKFDLLPAPGGGGGDARAILGRAGVPADATVWVAGSTHAGEEALIGGVYRSLRESFPRLFLVVVPRHVERTGEAVRDLRRAGLRPALKTEVAARDVPVPAGGADCLVLNTTGELRNYYAVADIVFVGKSLVGRGGQNIIEPALYGRPVLFGPHMDNFREVVRIFLAEDAMIRVRDARELEGAAAGLLRDPDRGTALGARARDVVARHRGACARTLDLIEAGWGDRLRAG